MRLLILSIFLILSFSACSSKHEPLNTVNKVDINKYLGTWYEIARYEHKFQKDCKNVSATYTLKEDGKINVLNQCINIKTDEHKKATGVAHAIDETFSKLKVTFFWPFYGDYWIIMIDKNYTYAVVGSPNREYLWILSREKTIDNKTKKEILDKLPLINFPIEKLLWTVQD